jgi:hypothetical protein
VEWHRGELFPRVGFVVTNLPMDPDWIIHFCNQRGTAEQHIKEGRQAINGTRLSCKGMAQNEAGFSFTHWPAISVFSCKARTFPRRWLIPRRNECDSLQLGMTTRIVALVDALGNLVRFLLLPGQAHDMKGVAPLIRACISVRCWQTRPLMPTGCSKNWTAAAQPP